jgi:hypothetical protein
MDMSQLKTQVMTMFMMKSASNPQGKGSSPGSEIFSILYSMVMLSAVEWAFKHAPEFFAALRDYLMARYKPKKPEWLPLADKPKKEAEQINSVTMMRHFKDAGNGSAKDIDRADNIYVEKVDAVLDYICNMDNARHVRMDIRCSLNNTEEIELTPLLKTKVKQTAAGEQQTVELVLFSTVLKVSDIRNWIDEIHSNYVAEKNNKLGNKIYYFNEVPHEPIVQTDIGMGPPRKTYRWDNMPKMLTFNMSEFKTSKSFNNVYGNHVDELKERLDLFVNHPEWYMERGIPHSLGIMLHGVPGAGKTSTIKAIAKDTNRHIFNLSLRAFTTQRQLTNLFFNETVTVHTYDGTKQTLKIPLNRRVYVIEDIDCLTDVVLDRSLTTQSENGAQPAQPEGDALTLSFLLNLLDGVLETPGRILVITSNYPEKLDKAFVRPGRIDVKIEFKNTTRPFILDMINKFYSVSMTLDEIPTDLEGVFTPAEVMESLCYYFKSPSQALVHLVNKRQAKKALEVQDSTGTTLADLGIELPADTETQAQAQAQSPEETLEKDQEGGNIVLAAPTADGAPMLIVKADDGEGYKSAFGITNLKLLPNELNDEQAAALKKKDGDLIQKAFMKPLSNVVGFNGHSSMCYLDYSLDPPANKWNVPLDQSMEGSVFDSPLFQDAVIPEGAGGNTDFSWTLNKRR